MNVLDKRKSLINSLTKEEKRAIAISVIEEEIKELREQKRKNTLDISIIEYNTLLCELDSTRAHLS